MRINGPAMRVRIRELFAARGPAACLYSVEVAEALGLEAFRTAHRVSAQLKWLETNGELVSVFVPAAKLKQTPGKRSGLGRRYYQVVPK